MSTHTHSQREALRFADENARSALKSAPSKFFRRLFVGGLLVCSLLGFAGCGKKGPERVQVFPVEGQLLVNGKPISDAQLVFHPKATGENALKANATTDKDGKFKLSTYDFGDGAVPGEYAVTVQHYTIVKTDDGLQRGPSDLPAKYTSPTTTDWIVKVAAQPNAIPSKTITR